MGKGTCTVELCVKLAYLRGWCRAHYSRWWRTGDPVARPTSGSRAGFLAHVDQADDCWLWTGAVTPQGYGSVRVRTGGVLRSGSTHRRSYELFVGPIPAGLTIDHECHNADLSCPGGPTCKHRRCVRPDHLVPRTIKANALRSPSTTAAKFARRTHCDRGHPFDADNTYVTPRRRTCRECSRMRNRAYTARKRERLLGPLSRSTRRAGRRPGRLPAGARAPLALHPTRDTCEPECPSP